MKRKTIREQAEYMEFPVVGKLRRASLENDVDIYGRPMHNEGDRLYLDDRGAEYMVDRHGILFDISYVDEKGNWEHIDRTWK